MGVNVVVIEGNLTRDPESKSLASGALCTFSIAHNVPKKNPSTGQWESEPHFFDVVAFNSEKRKLADTCLERLKKGMKVTVAGRLKQDRWQAQDGANRSKVTIKLEEISWEWKDGANRSSEGKSHATPDAPMKQGSLLPPTGGDENIPF